LSHLAFIPHLSDDQLTVTLWASMALMLLFAFMFRVHRPALFYRGILNHLRARPMMTEAERPLFRKLHIALGARYSICPQLAFSAFVTDSGKLHGRSLWKVRALFNTKRADFGIYDWHKNRMVALVELDDASHRGREENDRQIALATGLRTYRLRAGDDTSPDALAQIFSGLYTGKD
jgi:hypothetical protein